MKPDCSGEYILDRSATALSAGAAAMPSAAAMQGNVLELVRH